MPHDSGDAIDDVLSGYARRGLRQLVGQGWTAERAELMIRHELHTAVCGAVDRALAELSLAGSEGADG